jgi:hypothetical protein
MRQLASFLLLGIAVAAGAADTWRWKDANGVVHYSDRPAPGAERVQVGSSSGPGNAEAAAPQPATPAANPQQAQPVPTGVPYTSCVVVAPANDEVFNAVNSVSASLLLTPELQEGHRIQVLFDGQPYPAWPEGVLSYTIVDINRGTHSLSARLVDAEGRSLCTGPAITFHVRQPSVLSPARQRPRR